MPKAERPAEAGHPSTLEREARADTTAGAGAGAAAAAAAPAGRWSIDAAGELHEVVQESLYALVDANDERHPRVMVRGNELVRMTERGELEPLTAISLRERMSEAAVYHVARGESFAKTRPPADAAAALIDRDSADYGDLPRVERVVDVPVLTASGELLTKPGHDPASRLYLRPAEGLEGVAPPDEIGVEDVEEAREYLLRELLGDFGFADEASRAHALGLLLLPFVREYIPGPTPIHGILAPDIGSGKTTLAQACLLPGCGLVGATPQTGSEEEWRKRITSALLGGRSAILLDNLHGTLDSGSLAAALTSGTWSDRVLGESREIHLPVRNIWAATGNNLSFSAELTRRSVPVFIERGEVRAADRGRDAFRHPDLLPWAGRNRRELVRAALTLVEHWRRGPAAVEGGYVYMRTGEAPARSRKTLGSFEGWAAVVGGVLESCGVPGFLENRDRWTAEADEETREAATFLAALARETTDRPLEFHEVRDLCQFGRALHDAAPEGIGDMREERMHRALKAWMTKRKGAPAGDLELRNKELGGGGNPRGWYVVDRRRGSRPAPV
jgi:hypothetical protein